MASMRYFRYRHKVFATAITLPFGINVAASEDRLLAIVLDHLFPASSIAPGAREINANAYILRHFQQPESERDFLRNGLQWLNDLAHDEYASPFEPLPAEKREIVLKIFSTYEHGENWLSTLLTYTFEACFGDPVYGGNPNGIGWRWIDHRPGFPRPPANKLYAPT